MDIGGLRELLKLSREMARRLDQQRSWWHPTIILKEQLMSIVC